MEDKDRDSPILRSKPMISSFIDALKEARLAVADAVKDGLLSRSSKSIIKNRLLYPVNPKEKSWIEVRIDEGMMVDDYLFIAVSLGAEGDQEALSGRTVIARMHVKEGSKSDRVLSKQPLVQVTLNGLLIWLAPLMMAGARNFDEEQMTIVMRGFSRGDQYLLESLVSINACNIIPFVSLENPESAMQVMIENKAYVAANSLVFACVNHDSHLTVGSQLPFDTLLKFMAVAVKSDCLPIFAYAWAAYTAALVNYPISLGSNPKLPSRDTAAYDATCGSLLQLAILHDAVLCFAFMLNRKDILNTDYPRTTRSQKSDDKGFAKVLFSVTKTFGQAFKKRVYRIPKEFDNSLWDEAHPLSRARGNFFEYSMNVLNGAQSALHAAIESDTGLEGFWIDLVISVTGTIMSVNVIAVELLIDAGMTETQLSSFAEVVPGETFTALHAACYMANSSVNSPRADEIVNILLSAGAKPDALTSKHNLPLHIACERGLVSAAHSLILSCQPGVNVVNDDGYLPLHYACRSRSLPIVMDLLKNGGAVESVTEHGETPLHAALSSTISMNFVKKFITYTRAAVRAGAYDVSLKSLTSDPNTSLYASESELKDLERVLQALVSFDIDVNALWFKKENDCPLTALDLAHSLDLLLTKNSSATPSPTSGPGATIARSGTPSHVVIAESHINSCALCNTGRFSRLLRAVGAMTYEECLATEEEETKIKIIMKETFVRASGFPNDEGLYPANAPIVNATKPLYSMIRYLSMDPVDIEYEHAPPPAYSTSGWPTAGARILSLDGGGSRGVILIELLRAIEKAAGHPINQLFDLICGTSTGGLLALALTRANKSVDDCRMFYLNLVPAVFSGKKPLDVPFEAVLRNEFGESNILEDKFPKAFAVSSEVDTYPLMEYLFRTYPDEQTTSPRGTCNVKLRDAMRATAAAPMFFSAHTIGKSRYIDGAVTHNNPTLLGVSEVLGMHPSALKNGTVISLGTGAIPAEEIPEGTPFHVESKSALFNTVVKHSATYIRLVTEGLADSEKNIIPAARMIRSCGSFYTRFNPPVEFNIELDENREEMLVYMLYVTKVYIKTHEDDIERVAQRLSAKLGGIKKASNKSSHKFIRVPTGAESIPSSSGDYRNPFA